MIRPEDDFYSDFNTPITDSVVIERGYPHGRVALKAKGDRLFVVLEGEPKTGFLFECFREGLETGAVHTNMRTLVDLTHFTGSVDWGAVFALRKLAPWGRKDKGACCTAYVLRNDMFAALIKIVRTLYLNSTHCTFANSADAIAWLETAGES